VTARAGFPQLHPIATRWDDNDVYGHVNNVRFYAFFDTAINDWLVRAGGLDIHAGGVIGLCVESHCAFRAPIAFPDALEVGLRAAQIGRASVRYELAVFRAGESDAVAEGWFVHVFVERASRRPVDIPSQLRAALERLRPAEPPPGSASRPGRARA
jgi:acyl-CoA thioester hydrolase